MYTDNEKQELINKTLGYEKIRDEIMDKSGYGEGLAWDMLKLAITTKGPTLIGPTPIGEA